MAYFTQGVGGVGGGGHQHPGCRFQAAIDLGNGIPQAVEKDDVIRGDLGTAALIGGLADKLAGFENAPGMAVAPGVVVHDSIRDDLLHPGRDLFSLDDRVADVLPVDGDATFLQFFSHVDDVADFVGQFAGSGRHQWYAHQGSSFCVIGC